MKKSALVGALLSLAIAATGISALWLAACAGGTDGKDGADGKSAYEIWLETGHTGTENDFLEWLKGEESTGGNDDEPTYGLAFYPLPDGTYAVGAGNAIYLSEIVIPSDYNGAAVTEIVADGFSGCEYLEKITIPATITSVGNNAFDGCSSLSGVYIGDLAAWCSIRFEEIHDNPLYKAHNLYLDGKLVTNAVIPEGVTEIRDYVFSGCTSLTSITIPDGVTGIWYNAFGYCTELESVIMPDSVTRIYSFAFQACEALSQVDISDGVTQIDSFAFSSCCSLESVSLPDGVTQIGEHAFAYCSSLSNIVLPDSVTTIGKGVFNNCTSLESVAIPDGVASIEGWMFYGCSSLTEMVIPDSVTTIGEDAFGGCILLEEVYYGGTEEGWNNAEIVLYGNEYLINATVSCYSQTRPTEAGNYWHYAEDGKTPVKW